MSRTSTLEPGALARAALAARVAAIVCLVASVALAQYPAPPPAPGPPPGLAGPFQTPQGTANVPPREFNSTGQPPIVPTQRVDWDEEEGWFWQAVPDGLIYRSYLASPQEARLGLVTGTATHFGTIGDATLGGRAALLRYGTTRAYRPEGWELQVEGAAIARIQPFEDSAPLTSTNYRFGFPIVYGLGNWQFKTGYTHVSAHLGDEYMELHPTVTRINYVRDSIMFGVSYYYTEDLRLYGEIDYAAGIGGGALPWMFQTGVDYSPAVVNVIGTPFAAAYAELRPEVDGGYFVLQTGWQWRGGAALHTFRVGVQYLNGKSPQYEFFNQFEQDVEVGVWYDF